MSRIHGWLIIDKPLGLTSAQVVGRLRRTLRDAGHGRIKTGHGGTLDPLATGVLPIAFGEATKLSGYLLNGPKRYEFTIAFGAETSTDDLEGDITERCAHLPTEADIRAILPRFRGPISQIPPAYSALKLDGKRAYALARAGTDPADMVLPARDITIHSLELLAVNGASASLSVHCSKGTYVRSLARDIARALGSLGHVSHLRRTGAGAFALADAISLDKAVELLQGADPAQALLPLTAGLDDIPAIAVDAADALALRRGQRISSPATSPGQYIATHGSVPVALVRACDSDLIVVRGFNLDSGEEPDVDHS